jgi:3'(2'), 5'-bisphosphate nucleotidase
MLHSGLADAISELARTAKGLDDCELSELLATSTGKWLLALREKRVDSDTLRATGDASAHRILSQALAMLRPNDSVLSEEGSADSSRLSNERVWIVDPLDGTREFAEPGRDDWAVHVALWERGRLVAGTVALPARAECWSTRSQPAPSPGNSRTLRIVVSRTRAPSLARQLATTLAAELHPMGSAGAKTAAVLRGEADAYIHAGGQFEWDSAAPAAVALAAGLHASRLDGSALTYNQRNPSLPDVLICHRDLAPEMLAAIAQVRGGTHEGRDQPLPTLAPSRTGI